MKSKLGFWCGCLLIGIVLVTILSVFYPVDPNAIDVVNKLQPPSKEHFFGTDELGRDYFARVLSGGRVSLSVGFFSMIVSLILGVTVGVISGYYGGMVDVLFMRVVDVVVAIPSFVLLIVANAYFRMDVFMIILAIGALSWMEIARIVRAETLTLKEREFCLGAKVLGVSTFNIMRKYILRNMYGVLSVSAAITVANAILMESALSFLGLGVQLPQASWGSMLQTAQQYISGNWYLAIFPGAFIFLTVLCFNVISDEFQSK